MAKRVDRISELPVRILHQILCCTKLNEKDAARSCILSKRWYYCWSSRPNLIFHQLQKYSTNYTYMNLEKYVKLVNQSLRSHVKQNLHLEQFILTYHDPKLDSHLDTWIELAVKLNVTELGIHHPFSRSYSLPDVIYEAKKLTTLRLTRCKFEFDISTTHIRFYCLEVLYLHHVHILDAQLQRIIDRSPFIRTLSLVICRGINKLQVCGLYNLIIFAKLLFWMVTILYKHSSSVASRTNSFEMYPSEKLKKLSLSELKSMEKVTIQAPNLLNFILSRGTNLEKVTIQALKLLEFNFSGDTIPFSSMDPSSLEKARLKFFSTSTTNNILSYENPREILIPPSPDVKILIAPMLCVESIIRKSMFNCPRIMSILPCTNSKALQVLSFLKGCTQNQNYDKDCPFNIEYFHIYRNLKEVISYTGTSEDEMASIWHSWLKSMSLIDQAVVLLEDSSTRSWNFWRRASMSISSLLSSFWASPAMHNVSSLSLVWSADTMDTSSLISIPRFFIKYFFTSSMYKAMASDFDTKPFFICSFRAICLNRLRSSIPCGSDVNFLPKDSMKSTIYKINLGSKIPSYD
ncbi:hypothetical protein H5410_062567 [Solanum commersonii]|uniref:F-box/LRR-repeat protein 15/At3g58940/PEG3-like LRR domain-containing protein n=1 Tax=Solanum commersonii TaxID=4109 RepID=A0A9J5WB10_SOLCO|nr:hypothetical protein H5410_062567 [Solanum commersonii]